MRICDFRLAIFDSSAIAKNIRCGGAVTRVVDLDKQLAAKIAVES
jgi:hypothetical protein